MRKKIAMLTSLLLTLLLVIVGIFSINYSNSGNSQLVRNVELNNNSIVDDSYFDAFDSYDLVVEDNKSTFDGFVTINLAELVEIDNVASSDILNDASLKFNSSFDYDTGTSTLNVYVIDENEEVTIIDTIYGVALLAETGEVDVLFDFDGELMFLSELRDIGALDNVGWFTNLVKKAVNKVTTVANKVDTEVKNTATAVVKVLSTPNGAVGTVCTLAACAVVGAACSFIPGGQIVTTLCAGIAGSVIGKVGFELTAKAAQQQNPSITDEEISRYGAVGTIAGSAVSVASCNAMTTWRATHSTWPSKLAKQNLSAADQKAYEGYSKNGWKGNYPGQENGVSAGAKWNNADGTLPKTTSNGTSISYKEFDIYPEGSKFVNGNAVSDRGSVRFVHGSDGRTYITYDHYKSFFEIIENLVK